MGITRGSNGHYRSLKVCITQLIPVEGAGRSAAGAGQAEAAAAAKAERENLAETREMTFRPKIPRKSTAIAKSMGRDGTKVHSFAVVGDDKHSPRVNRWLLLLPFIFWPPFAPLPSGQLYVSFFPSFLSVPCFFSCSHPLQPPRFFSLLLLLDNRRSPPPGEQEDRAAAEQPSPTARRAGPEAVPVHSHDHPTSSKNRRQGRA